jgi:sRNA-binding carbon storage regulator CsrA
MPTIGESLKISSVKKRQFKVAVTAPKGSETWVQRKSGKKWITVNKIKSKTSAAIKVSASGTYRIRIVPPVEKVNFKTFSVKKRQLEVPVTAPKGSEIWVQRQSGKKWITVKKIKSKTSIIIKVSGSGTYRIQIVAPAEKVNSEAFKVK